MEIEKWLGSPLLEPREPSPGKIPAYALVYKRNATSMAATLRMQSITFSQLVQKKHLKKMFECLNCLNKTRQSQEKLNDPFTSDWH